MSSEALEPRSASGERGESRLGGRHPNTQRGRPEHQVRPLKGREDFRTRRGLCPGRRGPAHPPRRAQHGHTSPRTPSSRFAPREAMLRAKTAKGSRRVASRFAQPEVKVPPPPPPEGQSHQAALTAQVVSKVRAIPAEGSRKPSQRFAQTSPKVRATPRRRFAQTSPKVP